MVASHRPDLGFWVSFDADPNDPAAVPTWTDLTSRVRRIDGIKRGRQYELDQSQSAQPTVELWDVDEYLNPANTSSPYYPNVVPYRQCLLMAGWANPIAGNLLNTAAGMDGSFESYTAGDTVSWITAVGGIADPIISASAPQQGNNDLTWNVASGATIQGVAFDVVTMPGRDYTISGYVRQTSGSTQVVQAVGIGSGSTTTTTGSYVRLSLAFTATQPTTTIRFVTTGTAVAGNVRLDAVQLEPGSSASTFTTSGSVLYPVFRGFVERWPSTWDHAGFVGLTEITCVDGLAILAQVGMNTELVAAVMATAPDYYWPLWDEAESTRCAEVSGNDGPPLLKTDNKYGPSTTFAAGTETAIIGDRDGLGVFLSSVNAYTSPASYLQTGYGGYTPMTAVGSATFPYSITSAVWVARGNSTLLNYLMAAFNQNVTNSAFHTYILAGSPDLLYFQNDIHSVNVTDTWNDNEWHFYVQVTTVTNTTSTITGYVDGVEVATGSTGHGGIAQPVGAHTIIGGLMNWDGFTVPNPPNSTFAHYALWNRALSPAEISAIWTAGSTGNSGETSGARVARYLADNFAGTVNADAGTSTMTTSSVVRGVKLLDTLQGIVVSENGNLWAGPNGAIIFRGRFDRYQNTTSLYTFGELVTSLEIPYLGGVKYDSDPTFIYNDATVTQVDGVVAHAADATSVERFFKRTYERTIDVENGYEAIDFANWIVAKYKDPRQRIESLTVDPASFGVATPANTAWPTVLAIEVGDRVTVRRRAGAANSGAGLIMSNAFFVESVEHSDIDMEAGTWETTLLLSPVQVSSQVWLLGDATYGVLNSTSVLAY